MKTLYLPIGISGSGKTTYCDDLDKAVYTVLCPDKLRAIIGKDESDQTVNGKVFDVMRIMVEYTFKHSECCVQPDVTQNEIMYVDVVVDATNYSKKNRKDFVDIARKVGARIIVWYFNVPLALALERNSKRSRNVPESVIQRQFDNLEVPTLDEVDEVISMND